MTTAQFSTATFTSALTAHEELVSPTLALGLVTGVSLLPIALQPNEWFNLLWCGEEPTVEDSKTLGPAFEAALDYQQWLLANPTDDWFQLIDALSLSEYAMGLAMALNWGQTAWSDVGLEDGSDNDNLIGALMLVAVTLAWPNEQRPEGVNLPTAATAESQFKTAIHAVRLISTEYREQQETPGDTQQAAH